MSTKNIALDEVFPIYAIERNIIVNKNGDLTIPYVLTLPEFCTLGRSDYLRIHNTFVRSLDTLPVGMVLHKQDWFIRHPYQPAADQRVSPLVHNTLERHFTGRMCTEHRCLIFITRTVPMALKRKSNQTSLLSRRLVPQEITTQKYADRLEEDAAQFVANLEATSLLKLQRLREEQIDYQHTTDSLYQNYFSLSFHDDAVTDIELRPSLRVNGNYCGVVAVSETHQLPGQISPLTNINKYRNNKHVVASSTAGQMGMLLPFDHVYNQVYVRVDHDKLLNEIEQQANYMSSFSKASMQNETNMRLKRSFLEKVKETGERVIKTHCNVLTWHPNEETMLANRSLVKSAFTTVGFSPRLAVNDAAVLYWSSIPGNAGELGKDNLATCFTESAGCLSCWEGGYQNKTFGTHGVKLTDRLGIPRMVDIFVEPYDRKIIDNRNALVVGPSGSGKSVMMNFIQYYLYTQQTQIIVVDTGNSYKRLCDLIGGVYINFDEDKPMRFNPFYWRDGKLDAAQETDAKRNIVDLLIALWKKEEEPVTKSEDVGIESMVYGFYRYLEEQDQYIYPCFDRFFDYFTDVFVAQSERENVREQDIDLKNFAFVMRRFYKDNHFGFLLNAGPNDIINHLMDAPFIVFEMDNIKDNPTLHTVATMAVMNLYIRKLFRGGEAIFNMLVVEEAWRLVREPRFAKFMKWTSKTVRKHHGSLVTVAQEPENLESEIVKEAIVVNSAIKILMDFSQYRNKTEQVQQTLNLSDEEVELLMSVNQGRDPNRNYKESLISWNGHAKVYGVELSGEAYAAFTTTKDEVTEIEKLSKRTGSYEEAIKAYARGDKSLRPKRSQSRKNTVELLTIK
ncbi:MAG: TraG family conjugative transposon ATPase [Tunicatimonas sp.]|uniref:TraG family conjugative transposon ATPase n=1 Tax=Tunicatimonas sp. TaxID=1940096 RepID=UPI003C77AF30